MIDRLFFPAVMLALGALTALSVGEALVGPSPERVARAVPAQVELPRVVITARREPVELPRVVITAPRVAPTTDLADADAGIRLDPAAAPRLQ